MRRWTMLALVVATAACDESGAPLDPGPTGPDSLYVAAGTYQLAEVTLVHEGPCLDLYDREGEGEAFMGWFEAELQEGGSLSIEYRTDEYCYVDGSLSYATNHAGTAGGSWTLAGRDSLDVSLSNAIGGFLVPGVWFGDYEVIGGEVNGVVRIRPDTLVFVVEPESNAGGVVLKLARGGQAEFRMWWPGSRRRFGVLLRPDRRGPDLVVTRKEWDES